MAGVLQHLRSSTLDKRPNPASMVDGQVAINYASGAPGMFFKDSNGALVKVGPVHVGSGAPNAVPASGGTAGNSMGEQWLDTSGGTYVFKIWDGSAWRSEAGEFVNVTGDTMTGALGIIAGSAASPSLFISGDANTGLYSPGADQLAISTNGTGRLFVDSSGNVGIGTDDTANAFVTLTKQDVSLRLNPVTGAASITAVQTGVAFRDLTIGSNQTIFQTSSLERMRLDSSGRLGLGTSTPGTPLHVSAAQGIVKIESSTGTNSTLAQFTNTAGNAFVGLEGSAGGTFGTGAAPYSLCMTHQGAYPLHLITSNVVRATIDSSGRVGIGSTTPRALLDIGGSTAFSAGTYQSPKLAVSNGYVSVKSDPADGVSRLTLIGDSATGDGVIDWGGNIASSLKFTNNGTERGRWDSSGRFLVGTSSSTMSGGTVQQNGNLGIIANHATNVATNGTLDIVVNSGGGCYSGFLIVENTLASNAASRTQTTYAVLGRGTSATATSIATLNGSTSGTSFTLTYPSNGTIRVTNTHGGATNINMAWFGPTGY